MKWLQEKKILFLWYVHVITKCNRKVVSESDSISVPNDEVITELEKISKLFDVERKFKFINGDGSVYVRFRNI